MKRKHTAFSKPAYHCCCSVERVSGKAFELCSEESEIKKTKKTETGKKKEEIQS